MTAVVDDVAAKNSTARASRGRAGLAPTGERISRSDRVAQGKDARAVTPLDAHAEIGPDRSRDPVGLLLDQAKSRVPELVPIRHGRMLVSPFTYYRGAALPMTADLATTPVSGLRVQVCGDAHLSNFGAFASPERRLVFDVNDFDETLPGPFEWDVKRLAASFAIAGRDNGYSAKVRRRLAVAVGESYRTAMREFADRPLMEVWYARLDADRAVEQFQSQIKAKRFNKTQALVAKAHTHDSMQVMDKLTTMVDGRRAIISDPPTIVPVEEVFADIEADAVYDLIRTVLAKYRRSHAVRPPAPARPVLPGTGGPQGGRRRQRRHPGLDRADGRGRRRGAAVPAGQGGPAVGAGRVLRAQPVRQPGRAGRRRATPDAGRE